MNDTDLLTAITHAILERHGLDALRALQDRARLHLQARSTSIVVGERLIWDTTSPTSAATPLGATYTPTVNATFTIYVACGVTFELADGSGN